MADRIVLNTPRYKGEYDFDLEEQPLTALEWRWVKKISGYLPMTLSDGFRGGDPDLFVAFAVIALVRAGRVHRDEALTVADTIADLPFDGTAITLLAEEVDAEDPPVVPAETPEIEQPLRSIGGSSPQTLANQVVDLSRTGALA
jgi:hypothetical protein